MKQVSIYLAFPLRYYVRQGVFYVGNAMDIRLHTDKGQKNCPVPVTIVTLIPHTRFGIPGLSLLPSKIRRTVYSSTGQKRIPCQVS